jgi:Co/Zn/Cd efflux system component
MADAAGRTGALARVVALVAALNLGYFAVEISVALAIGSVALLADSADFLEDAAVNLLILLGLSWSVRGRARLGTAIWLDKAPSATRRF